MWWGRFFAGVKPTRVKPFDHTTKTFYFHLQLIDLCLLLDDYLIQLIEQSTLIPDPILHFL
jgi:hypothetical protein